MPSGARRLAVLAVATAGGVGFAPVASGTFGALVGVGVYLAIASWGAVGVLGVAVAVTALGIGVAGEAELAFGRHDDGRIVIDEVAGQLWCLAPLAATESATAPALVVGGFLAFRLFDIWKPGPVRWAERRFSGGAGVMLDDVVAGMLGAAVVAGGALLEGSR